MRVNRTDFHLKIARKALDTANICLLQYSVQDDLCELRFDVPLADGDGPHQFERGWRAVLAAQRLTTLAMPPAHAVSARFRLCGTSPQSEETAALSRYLPARLAALPGTPSVAAEAPSAATDWRGVRIWLAYPAHDLPGLMQRSKQTKHPRGRRR
jgi:hypothetical protein